jgi:hypothetical protein
MNPADVIEQFADGEAVAPEALVAALATAEGREHLRGILELRALLADAPVHRAAPLTARASSPARFSAARAAAVVLLAGTAAAVGYTAGTRQELVVTPAARVQPVNAVNTISDAPPAPTTVIKLDATHGWRDQSGGF